MMDQVSAFVLNNKNQQQADNQIYSGRSFFLFFFVDFAALSTAATDSQADKREE